MYVLRFLEFLVKLYCRHDDHLNEENQLNHFPGRTLHLLVDNNQVQWIFRLFGIPLLNDLSYQV